jgi:hypothetical protein
VGLDHNYRSDLYLLPDRYTYNILQALMTTLHKYRKIITFMTIMVKNNPQLFWKRQNHMSVSYAWLKHVADLRYKIICITLSTGQEEATLAGVTHPLKILASMATTILAIATCFLAA